MIVAANRDEFFARPAVGPSVLDPSRGVVGGRDHKGGTWMGLTRGALFVGLTNQRTAENPPPNARSRGEVVLEALRAGSVDGVLSLIERTDVREFPAFNLVFGDGATLWVAYARAEGWQLAELAPGVHVLANDRLGSPWFPKADRLRHRVEAMVDLPYPALRAGLEHALADNEVPEDVPVDPTSPVPIEWARALQALCIHTEVYGTRSSTIAALSTGVVADYRYCEGAPDQGSFVDFTALLTGE